MSEEMSTRHQKVILPLYVLPLSDLSLDKKTHILDELLRGAGIWFSLHGCTKGIRYFISKEYLNSLPASFAG